MQRRSAVSETQHERGSQTGPACSLLPVLPACRQGEGTALRQRHGLLPETGRCFSTA